MRRTVLTLLPLLCTTLAACMSDPEKERRETLAMREWQVGLAVVEMIDEVNPRLRSEISAMRMRPGEAWSNPVAAGALQVLKSTLERIESLQKKYVEACRDRFDAARCETRAAAIAMDPSAALRIARQEGLDYRVHGSRAGDWLGRAASDLSLAPNWRAPPP